MMSCLSNTTFNKLEAIIPKTETSTPGNRSGSMKYFIAHIRLTLVIESLDDMVRLSIHILQGGTESVLRTPIVVEILYVFHEDSIGDSVAYDYAEIIQHLTSCRQLSVRRFTGGSFIPPIVTLVKCKSGTTVCDRICITMFGFKKWIAPVQGLRTYNNVKRVIGELWHWDRWNVLYNVLRTPPNILSQHTQENGP